MKRDPYKEEKIKYFKNISIRKCFPIFYRECCKCKMEFRWESMYECVYPHYSTNWYIYKQGCNNCFSSKEDFRKFLEKCGSILTEENYDSVMAEYKW